jgi:post-segregation antitoxin (ccd killing protein)
MQISGDINKESSKQKLTLGIDRNVIEKAKAAGLNISAITEQLLKAITYKRNDGVTTHDVAIAYQALFDKAQSLLSEYTNYEFYLDVGEGGFGKVQLDSIMGLVICDDNENIIKDNVSVDSVVDVLYDPMEILENLIGTLTIIAEYNKQQISKLKFALRLVKALSDDEEEDNK